MVSQFLPKIIVVANHYQKALIALTLALSCLVASGLPCSAQTTDFLKTKESAERGDPTAQCFLGNTYLKAKHYGEAFKWLSMSAEQGDNDAQGLLGFMYSLGLGVPRNDIIAYKWLSLAAAGNDTTAKNAQGTLVFIARYMTEVQIAEGQRLSAAFVPKKQAAAPQASSTIPSKTTKATLQLKATGTAFAITKDGFLLTNLHVITASSIVKIKTSHGILPAKVIMKDKTHDLALLKVSGTFSPLPFDNTVKLGEAVFTIGFPDFQLQGLQPKLTRGEISSLAGMRDDTRYFQISVPLQPGNSGGPLVDLHGNVVGMTSAGLDEVKVLKVTGSLPQNVNYAIKSAILLDFLWRACATPDANTLTIADPHDSSERKFEDVVQEVEGATVMVLVY